MRIDYRFVTSGVLAATFLFAAAAPCAAQQEEPRLSVAGGYAWFREQGAATIDPAIYPIGWVATGSFTLAGRLAAVGEFSMNMRKNPFDETQALQSITGGAAFRLTRSTRVKTFAQVLAGLERFSEPGFSESGFALQAGFGMDITMGSKAFIRGQADYRRSTPSSGVFNDVRVFVGAGIGIGK